ncbi:hypothetical protein [Aeoliella mucimassa]|uniref:hypothetical protein n=1 Tax=Aeoliella mucimassa TaxID=2527972 RepID=UPI0011A4D9AE|nr:hypothetical protein [Aeoliella mucimassa]
MTVEVRQVSDSRQAIADFIAVSNSVYAGDRHYTKPTRKSVERSLTRPEFAGRQRCFLAERQGKFVGRLVARLPAEDSQAVGESSVLPATIGDFESHNDPQAAVAMLLAAVRWLREQGATEIIGPMEGDTWHRYRLVTGPFDDPPFLMEPYNPAYYPALWQQAGFAPFETYHSKKLEDVRTALERFEPIHQRAVNRGFVLEPFRVDQFESELERLYRLSLAIFAANKLYSPISADEFFKLYESARSLLDRRLVWFACSPEGEDVGFVFAVHDYHDAAVAMRGQDGWLAKLRFVMHKRRAKAINIKSLGVVPGQRHSGLGVALVAQVYREMLGMGFQRANLCLIHDDNPSSRLDAGLGTMLRHYTLYKFEGAI